VSELSSPLVAPADENATSHLHPAGRFQRDLPRWVIVSVFALFALVVAGFVGSQPSGYLVGGPGPVFDVAAQLDGGDDAVGWLLLTVSYDEVTWAGLLRRHLTGNDTLVLGPGQFNTTMQRRSAEQMAESRAAAAAVAGTRLGRPVAAPDLDLAGVGGGSGGLAIALALLDTYSDGDLAGGRIIAATGTLDPDGTVGPVGGVPFKAQAALDAGANVLIVPSGNAKSVPTDLALTVVVVDHIDEALDWLCANGATTPLCAER
jgi:PDZ domain-containing secreted protein